MSMISGLIDELRRMADGQATYRDARAVMLQAADTIWELRDDLQRANAENAKLRELVRVFYHCTTSGYADTFAFAHHHEPTVEDVLREFTDEVWNRCCEGATASDSGIDELVAECAAKLRLAGENA